MRCIERIRLSRCLLPTTAAVPPPAGGAPAPPIAGLGSLIMRAFFALACALTFCVCSREDRYHGPSGFVSEEMGLQLSSIPHQKVVHYNDNGRVLILSLSDADLATLRSDSRFHWRRPDRNGTSILDGWTFIDHDKYDVLADQWSKGTSQVREEWRFFGLDSTRKLLFLLADHWLFVDLPPRIERR